MDSRATNQAAGVDGSESALERIAGRTRRIGVVRAGLSVLGLGFLTLLVWVAGWDGLVNGLSRLGGAGAAALLGLGLAEFLLDVLSLRSSMLTRIPFSSLLVVSGAGALVNLFVPLEAGEVVKAGLLRGLTKDLRALSGLAVWNYSWKLAKPLAVLLTFVGAVGLGHRYGDRLFWPLAGATALAFLPYLGLRFAIRLSLMARAGTLLSRLLSREAGRERWAAAASRLDEQVRTFWTAEPRRYLAIVGQQLAGRGILFVSTAMVAVALGVPSDAGSLLAIFTALAASEYFVALLPIRVGAGEGAFYVVFQVFGLDPTLGVILGVTLRLRAVAAQAVLAMAGMLAWPANRRPEARTNRD